MPEGYSKVALDDLISRLNEGDMVSIRAAEALEWFRINYATLSEKHRKLENRCDALARIKELLCP